MGSISNVPGGYQAGFSQNLPGRRGFAAHRLGPFWATSTDTAWRPFVCFPPRGPVGTMPLAALSRGPCNIARGKSNQEVEMNYGTEKVDDVVPALMWLTILDKVPRPERLRLEH